MELKTYQGSFTTVVAVMMMAFFSIIIATANPSFAATGAKKTSAAARTNAVEVTESRIKQLQVALKINEDQEVLWSSFTQVMRENAKDMDVISKDRIENRKTLNAVEHMKFHSQITESQLNHQKKLIPPFEALYASMSDDQKKITDTLFRTGKHGKHKIQ